MADISSSYSSPIPPRPGSRGVSLNADAGFPWRMLVASVVVFVLTLLIYLGMAFGFEPYLKGQVTAQTAQLNQLTSSMDQTQQQASLNFYSQLYNISKLTASRVDVLPLFSSLEAHTPDGVRLTGAQADLTRGQVELAGTAPSFDAVIASAASWRGDQNVTNVVLENMKTTSGPGAAGVTFSMRIVFASGVFNIATN